MTESFASFIAMLDQRKTAIERALVALREVDGITAPDTTTPALVVAPPEASVLKGKKRSDAVRRKMALAQKTRWAKIKGQSESPATPRAPKPKRKISADGIKRIIAATKKRWALKRAEVKAALEMAEGKKAARKKTGGTSKKVGATKRAVVNQKAVKKSASVGKGAKKSPPIGAQAVATPIEGV